LPKGDPGEKTAHRWRKAFLSKVDGRMVIDPQKMKEAIEDARLRCVRICERQKMSTIRGTEGTGEFLRYTPSEYVDVVRKALGRIDLDPASDKQAQRTVKAEKYFTEEDDGLEQEWHGNIFLNPPYSKELAPKFIHKLVAEFEAGHVKSAILLTNNCTETEWFEKAAAACDAICFTRARIPFIDPKKPEPVAPTQGQTFFFFGEDVAGFAKHFSEIGWFSSFGCTR
jgi:ParB family chromosome partitioning protein